MTTHLPRGTEIIARVPGVDGTTTERKGLVVRYGRDAHGVYIDVLLAFDEKRRLHPSLVRRAEKL